MMRECETDMSSSPLDIRMSHSINYLLSAVLDTCELVIIRLTALAYACSCPDEGDQCLAQIAVGQACQKDRDGKLPRS